MAPAPVVLVQLKDLEAKLRPGFNPRKSLSKASLEAWEASHDSQHSLLPALRGRNGPFYSVKLSFQYVISLTEEV